MKYYKLSGNVFAFDLDQLDFVKPEMVEMTEAEIVAHLNPPHPPKLFPALTRRQFKLALLENNLLTVVDTVINNIPDPLLKARIEIEYTDATEFVRTSESVKYMLSILELSEEQANIMWEAAQAL